MKPVRSGLSAAAAAGLVLALAAASASFASASPARHGRHRTPAPAADVGGGLVYSFGVVGTGFGPKIAALEHRSPTQVRGIPGTVVEIATSNSDSYALTASGTVWAWGAGSTGELGNGTTAAYSAVPVKVQLPAGVTITALANPMPYDSALAIDSRGDVFGWGYNLRNTICLPETDVVVPTELPLSDVSLATGAGEHSLFDAGGHVSSCGRNSAGELGNGTTADSALPTPVLGLPDQPVRALVSSWQGSGALMADGSYYDWGFGKGGQLGDGSTADSARPVEVRLPGPVRLVSQGGSQPSNGQTLAVLADGSVWAWGDGSFGQLGDGNTAASALPVRVALPRHLRVRQVFSGGDSSYALSAAGRLWTWGGNMHGQLGDGSVVPVSWPSRIGLRLVQISATATNVTGLTGTRGQFAT